jgi:DNA invertase Pin-like site-specific DNA recombinase
MSKVYGYCRVAFADEEAMAEQVKLVGDYCRDNGLTVDKYFCDNGASGLILDRKGLNELLKVLQDGDTVVVRDIARLSRSSSQCISLLEQMKDLNIELKIIK